MGAIAQASGGRFHYVDDSSKVAAFFQDQVLRLESVYAKASWVELVPGPGVRIDGVMAARARGPDAACASPSATSARATSATSS